MTERRRAAAERKRTEEEKRKEREAAEKKRGEEKEREKKRRREEREEEAMAAAGKQMYSFKKISKASIRQSDGIVCYWVIWENRGTWEVEEFLLPSDPVEKRKMKVFLKKLREEAGIFLNWLCIYYMYFVMFLFHLSCFCFINSLEFFFSRNTTRILF